MLHVENLIKTYDTLRAVDGITFSVGAGEVVGLVGPNGAGKTTTLRSITGIIPPTSGTVRVDGRDLDTDPVEAKRRLAFVPDEPHLFDYLTVWDHVLVLSRIYGAADGPDRALALLTDFGLLDRRNAYPNELSRGMKQKVLLALALLYRPGILVLDEPLTGLDPRAMRQTKDLLLTGAREGMGVLVSSHMLHLVEEICHRVLVIRAGRIVLEGPLGEIRALGERTLEEIFLQATEDDRTP